MNECMSEWMESMFGWMGGRAGRQTDRQIAPLGFIKM